MKETKRERMFRIIGIVGGLIIAILISTGVFSCDALRAAQVGSGFQAGKLTADPDLTFDQRISPTDTVVVARLGGGPTISIPYWIVYLYVTWHVLVLLLAILICLKAYRIDRRNKVFRETFDDTFG